MSAARQAQAAEEVGAAGHREAEEDAQERREHEESREPQQIEDDQ